MTHRHRLLVAGMIGAAAVGCADRPRSPVIPPEPPAFLAVPIACRVDADLGTGRCAVGQPERGTDAAAVRQHATGRAERLGIPDPRGFEQEIAILGGHAASLTVSGVVREPGSGSPVIAMQVTISNLLDQTMGLGTPGATQETVDSAGVRLFVEQGPTGEGGVAATASWLNPDLIGATGSAPGQSAMRYASPIVPGGSATRAWRVRLDGGATGFTFRAVVVTALADEGPGAGSAATLGISQLSVGYDNSCALSTTQRAYCWWWFSAYGLGTTALGEGVVATPSEVPLSGSGYVLRSDFLVSSRRLTLCALRQDGVVRCRGDVASRFSRFGAPHLPSEAGEVAVAAAAPLVSLTMAATVLCGLDAGGGAWCFSNDPTAPVGTMDPGVTPSTSFRRVEGGGRYTALAAGDAFVCGLTMQGRPWCWGANDRGQLGVTLPRAGGWRSVPAPVADNAPSRTYVVIAAASATACALDDTGMPWCWGSNASGALGTSNDVSTAFRADSVSGLGAVRLASLVAGPSGFCGLTSAGALWCWGKNDNGMFAADTSAKYQATLVQAGLAFSTIAMAGQSMCGIRLGGADAGRPVCWGASAKGILGQPAAVAVADPARVLTPRPVSGLPPFAVDRLAMSGTIDEAAACAWTSADRRIWCWGINETEDAPLNPGIARRNSLVPVGTPTGRRFSLVAAGFRSTCGIEAFTDALFCWGEVPDGSGTTVSGSPVRVTLPGGRRAIRLSVGQYHSCVVGTTGDAGDRPLYCWGNNAQGQLGDSTFSPRFSPTLVKGALKWRNVAAGESHTCAVEDGTRAVWCWGSSSVGQIGPGSLTAAPRVIGGLSSDTVVAGRRHSCGLDTVARVTRCWGGNNSGQLGRGTLDWFDTPNPSPQPVPVIGDVASVAAGGNSTCALTVDGLAWCWGEVRTTGAVPPSGAGFGIPVVVATGLVGGRVAVSSGTYCDVTADGRARCGGVLTGNGSYTGSLGPLRLPVAGVP